MRFYRLAVLGGAVVVGALLWGSRGRFAASPPFTPAPQPAVRPTNVLLVSIDTLRPDHLSLYGYGRATSPHLDAFARAAMTYDNAYATASFTSPSVASMLTGLYPASHGVRFLRQALPDGVWTLPQYLRTQGWTTVAVVSNWILRAGASGLDGHFDIYDDEMTERERVRTNVLERTAGKTTDAALAYVRNARRPLFLWVHYIDPHGPYTPPAPFDQRFRGAPRQSVRREKIPWYQRVAHTTELAHYVDQYDGEIAYADAELGRLLAGIDALDLFASTLVIVTSDHGEGLTDRHGGKARYFQHGHHTWEELARVPLVVYRPGGPVGRTPELASLADIAPTILAVLGLAGPPTALDGVPLEGHRRSDVLVEASEKRLRAIRSGHIKLLAQTSVGAVKQIEGVTLFDLAKDPGERHGAPALGHPDAAPLLLRLTHELSRDTTDLAEARDPLPLPRAAAERAAEYSRLRALGYVE